MARKLSLARLLAQRKLRDALEQLAGALGEPLAVLDPAGTVLLGDCAEGERHPLELSGEIVGTVVGGGRAAGALAALLNVLASGEADKKDLAREGVQKYRELAVLYEVSEKIGACLRIEDTAHIVLEEVQRVIRKGRPRLALLDPETGRFSSPGAPAPPLPEALCAFLRELVGAGRAEIVNTVADDARLATAVAMAHSLMVAPLKTKDVTIGALLVLCEEPVEFRSEELRLLSALATLCASSIEKARLYEKVERETRLRSNFQRYLSPSIVEDIIANRAEIALGGKSVECSVLFSDLCGFTSLTELRQPEEIIALLNEYFSVMAEIILRHGGTLDKFIGDAIMAVFGAPCELPDAHRAAVQVALEMQQAMARLQWKWAATGWPPVHHRVGINTGRVIAGNIGSELRMDYTVVGDAVNLAARVEALCAPMETTFSDRTWEKVRPYVVAQPLAPVQVKGKAQPVVPHQMVALRSGSAPAELWETALPMRWGGGRGPASPGVLVGLSERHILVETPRAPVPGEDVEIQLDAAAHDAPALRALVRAVEARTDGAGNGFFRSRLACTPAELPPALRRLCPPAGPAGNEEPWELETCRRS